MFPNNLGFIAKNIQMPKISTFPTLFENVLKLNLSKLQERIYLEIGQKNEGTLTWGRNGEETGSISIIVNLIRERPFIELDYKYGNENRNYKIPLVSIPSNLGKGKVFYFLCPITEKRCRILYCINGYFLHREAFEGCMYEKQRDSKEWRKQRKALERYYASDDIYKEIYSRHFKKYYKGKPTKRYLKLIQKIKLYENYTSLDIERIF